MDDPRFLSEDGVDLTLGEHILATMGHFTKAERKVARALLSTYPIAGLETVAHLAERAEVSAPTVVRFVNKLGYQGYGAFQGALRGEVQTRLGSPLSLYRRQLRGGATEEVLRSSQEIFKHSLETAFHHLPPAEFQGAADLLADQRYRVLAIGGRFSQILAYYLVAHLHSLRPGSYLIGSGLMSHPDELLDVSRRDVLVAFDYRRYQADTIQAAHLAAERGASIILFTDPWLSPIADVARYVLTSPVDAPSPFDSLVAALATLEALVAAITLRLGNAGRTRVERLDEVRDQFGHALLGALVAQENLGGG